MDDDTLNYPVPDGLDPLFRAQYDTAGDFMPAYERAVLFSATMDSSRMSYLWQQALEIGFRAGGSGGSLERAPFDDYSFGHDEGVKEGRTSGLRDGKKEGRKTGKAQGLKEGEILGFEKGLSEGKRLGFVAGREFGEKQAAKLSKPIPSERTLVDTGTDSPPTELSLPLAPSMFSYSSVCVQTDVQCDTTISTVPLVWADEPLDVRVVGQIDLQQLPPRDFSALRSDLVTSTPFATLRYRAHRTQKSSRYSRRSRTSTRIPHPPRTMCGPVSSFVPKNSTADTGSSLDGDPRLSDLSRALHHLGWDLVRSTPWRRRHQY
ncbi:hypothetical protein C8R47DRAFT_1170873 [Mycena vitilis]|nr:hypothetical protein C8R47DRAFT_1170873 [Mycena vitilis]